MVLTPKSQTKGSDNPNQKWSNCQQLVPWLGLKFRIVPKKSILRTERSELNHTLYMCILISTRAYCNISQNDKWFPKGNSQIYRPVTCGIKLLIPSQALSDTSGRNSETSVAVSRHMGLQRANDSFELIWDGMSHKSYSPVAILYYIYIYIIDNGLPPLRHHANIRTNIDVLLLNCIWKCRLHNLGHYVSATIWLYSSEPHRTAL